MSERLRERECESVFCFDLDFMFNIDHRMCWVTLIKWFLIYIISAKQG